MADLDAGALLDGRYRLIERRASGATATVWAAEDDFLRRRVAIKILHPHIAVDADLLDRFVNEARTAATVSHPALVAVFDSIVDHPGIVLEWVEGLDLRQRLDAGPIAANEVAVIGAQIAEGLAAMHHQGLIHRDVKPANILLSAGGGAKLTDFGITTSNAGDRTATGIVLGTPKYLAPEQVRGETLDRRTDLFSLAAVLYEAVAGAPPWERDGDLPTAIARLDEDPTDLRTSRTDLPASLTATIMRGLARDRNDRWPDGESFANALRDGSRLLPPPARPVAPTLAARTAASPVASTGAIRARRRIWPRLLGLAVVVAIALLGWTLMTAIDDDGSGDDPELSTDARATLVAVEAFDPEGSGAPGEHSDRAFMAIDGDPSTIWSTELYRSRDLGGKSGVGLIITLERVGQITAVQIETSASSDWAVEIRVGNSESIGAPTGIDSFGPSIASESGLGATAVIPVNATGDLVVVWFTDLGSSPTPIALNVAEVTVR